MPSVLSQQIHDYQTMAQAFQDVLGIIITEEQRNIILAKLNRVMQAFELDSIIELAEKMRHSDTGRLNSDILQAITNYDSRWFQNKNISELLQHYVLDNVEDNARFWVVGCEDGSLAYSVAIEIAEYNRINNKNKAISIIATDVSREALKQAGIGRYRTLQIQGLAKDMRSMYMDRCEQLNDEYGDTGGDIWEVKPEIRDQINFTHCDLMKGCQSAKSVEIIICPDILVYFSNSHRKNILQQFSQVLDSSGILIVGEDQVIVSENFERVQYSHGIFYRQKD